jgi:hypothetical protein
MCPISRDPLDRFPDVVAALATALPAKTPPPTLKARLDARLREFTSGREASFHLLSRPADRVRERLLAPPDARRGGRGRPLGRVVLSACGREAAFFCWYLPSRERFSLAFRRADGSAEAVAALESDGTGDGELPYLRLPPGPPVVAVELRRDATGEVALAARL